MSRTFALSSSVRADALIRFTALLVAAHGLFILATTLLDQLQLHHGALISAITIDVPLLIGISLIYLSSLLLRRKQTAWVVALVVYIFFLGYSATPLLISFKSSHLDIDTWVRSLVLPAVVIGLLVGLRRLFVVRSDIRAFRSSLKIAAFILAAALAYGVTGFLLLDKTDFHHEVSVTEAIHRTVDQFDLTTNAPLQPHTRRAHVFVDSLSVVSIVSVGYVLLSLFQPLKSRFVDQAANRQVMLAILTQHGGRSEDFFKLWPQDKQYYFDDSHTSGIAFQVNRGVALCMGDPVGKPVSVRHALKSFETMCYYNDWLPAFIHTEATHKTLYQKHGFAMQKIGEEAVVDVKVFETDVLKDKYFRNIRNRFKREGYTAELLQPPHHQAILNRLHEVSDVWLDKPGRTERGFVMGYYRDDYIQQCPVLVARDAAGTIQGFINQVPARFDSTEATYDFLRQTDTALSNTNDFLLISFIQAMAEQGYQRVNLGLSPLVGLDSPGDNQTIIDNFLRFAYANGDRFYSFSGLHRFKAKYKPEWRTRYIVYREGVAGFAKTVNALMRAMQVKNS